MAEYTFSVGQETPVKGGFLKRTTVIYAGMLNEKTYSLVVTHSIGYRSMAYNLFLPVSRREITIGRNRFNVLRISEDEIRFSD